MSDTPRQYSVRFCRANDPHGRYLIVCVDKRWGDDDCQPWNGDLSTTHPHNELCATYFFFTPTWVLTAVTSSDNGYYYEVEFIDSEGNVAGRCDRVDRYNPCYLYLTEPTPTPTPTPTSAPSCPPLIRTGNDVLDHVVFCVRNVGITVFVLIVFFLFLLLLLRRLRRWRR